jgi:hypothetical protein
MGRGMGPGVLEGGMGEEITSPESRKPAEDDAAAPEQDLEALKRQSQLLAQELEALQKRIQEMEKKKEE